MVGVRGSRHQPRHVVPRDARRGQRAADAARGGADRVRSRLPRGDLRLVRPDDQRRGPRPAAGHRHLPAPHAELQGRRRRSTSSPGGPGPSRSSRTWWWIGARSTASSQAGGYITAPTGGAQDANTILIPKDDGGHRHGRGPVHRLRRLRGGLSQRLGVALHRGQDQPPRSAAPGPAGALPTRASHGARRWTSRASARCTLYGECQEACPKEISIDTITRMNRDFLRASLSEGRAAVAEVGLRVRPGAIAVGAAPPRNRCRSGPPSLASAQSSPWIRLGANGVAALTAADPVPGGQSLAEVRLVQPAVMVHAGACSDRLRFLGHAQSRGRSRFADGELTPGAWGEGFIDRRHPHTYRPRADPRADDLLGRADGATRLSLDRREGVRAVRHRRPDDPAGAPLPGQSPPGPDPGAGGGDRGVLRAGLIVSRPACSTATSPSSPDQWPQSSAGSATRGPGDSPACPVRGLELQASYAHVHSPEHRPGAGTDQQKWSVSGRWDGAGRARIRCTAWSSGPGPRRPRGSSSSIASWPRVHGPRAVTVSITGSSEPSGRRRSAPWTRFARSGPTSRTRFSV